MIDFRSTGARLFALVLFVGVSGIAVRAVAPTSPSNLVATVSGQVVTLTWTASANGPTQYILQAGFAPGQTAFTFSQSGATTGFTASAPAGTYYARVVAVNGDGTSGASNEVTVVVSTGCATPSAPRNLRGMIKGAEAFLFWNPSSGGVSGYSVQAGTAPGQTFTQFATSGTTLNANVGGGTFFVRVIATSPCGNSAASNEVTLSFPANTVRVADPEPGTILSLPEIRALITRINAAFPATASNSCPTGRKYEPNPWQNNLVDQLRTYDTRFGYNAKPTRTSVDNNGFPVIAAGDEITYFYGSGNAQGSSAVYALDVLFGHCGNAPEITYRDIAPEPAIWTGAGRFTGDQRDEQ